MFINTIFFNIFLYYSIVKVEKCETIILEGKEMKNLIIINYKIIQKDYSVFVKCATNQSIDSQKINLLASCVLVGRKAVSFITGLRITD